MVTAAPAPPAPGAWAWRPYGVALLPLCLAGALPLWTVAALAALLALSVRWPVWAQGRVLITQLVLGVGLLTALTGALNQPAALLTLGAQYLLLSVLGFVLIWGVSTLEEGQRRGLLAPLLIGALFPQPLVLVALFGGALARYDRKTADMAAPAPRAWWGLLGAGLLGATLLAALLPPAPSLWSAFRPNAVTAEPRPAAEPQPVPEEEVPPGGGAQQTSAQTPWMVNLGQMGFPTELTLLAGLLCVMGAARLFQGRSRRQGPPHPAEILMIAGLLVLGVAWLVATFLLWREGAAGDMVSSEGAAAQVRPADELGGTLSVPRMLYLPLLQVLPWLTTLLFLAIGVWLLRLKFLGSPVHTSPAEETAGLVGPAVSQPLHRVRQAYRVALGALAGAGLGRALYETPTLYAARLTELHPALAEPLHALTAAYEPVRYGGQLTDQDASAAEAAAHTIRALASTLTSSLPPPEDTP